jgi:hypothetical protein
MMKLEEFVSETFRSIIDGVRSAQRHAKDVGAEVAPRGATSALRSYRDGVDEPIQLVEFDVAVTSSEGAETKGGVGVFLAPLALGSQGRSEAQNVSVSRIKFAVAIVLPDQDRNDTD